MIRYKTRNYSGKIEKVEIERETEKYVFLPGGYRDNKAGELGGYFKTFPEAVKSIRRRIESEIKIAQQILNSHQDRMNRLQEMYPEYLNKED